MERKRPVGGVDYPQTFQDFDEWFSTEAACQEFLKKLRWPDGFRCPHCEAASEAWGTARGLLHCRRCQGQTSVTAGTIFEGTRKPLRTWFLAMWFVTSQKHGVSALGLQRVLGLGSYSGLEAKGYKHRVTKVSRREELAHELLPRVHLVASLLKRWLLGTHQGAVGLSHLAYYLDEFTFRFN